MIALDTPKDFNANLVQRVVKGLAHVINNIEYNSLPKNLQRRYYPLYRRSDTTYRMLPKFMKARRDIDPNTQVVRVVPRKSVNLKPQVDRGNLPRTIQKEILPINTEVSVPRTEMSRKGKNTLAQEARVTANNRVEVKTQFSRY